MIDSVNEFDYVNSEKTFQFDEKNGKLTFFNNDFNYYRIINIDSVSSIVFNDGIDVINIDQFRNYKNLQKVEFPESLKKIGDNAFRDCINLSSIVFKNDNIDFGKAVFRGCKELRKICLPFAQKIISKELFCHCSQIEYLEIPFTVERIEKNSFGGCRNLLSIHFPQNIKNIEDESFQLCHNLSSIKIDNLDQIEFGQNAFLYSFNIKDIIVNKNSKKNNSFIRSLQNCYIDTNDSYPIQQISNLNTLSSYLFYHSNIDKAFIPNNISEIGDFCFSYSMQLQEIKFQEKSILSSIGNEAFRYCNNLSYDIIIPNSVKIIGEKAFDKCKKLSSIQLPKNLSSIERCTFYDTNLESIDIPDSVISIGDFAFANNKNLKSISLSKKIKYIGEYAFYECRKLSSITFKTKDVDIADNAFFNCFGLRKNSDIQILSNLSNYLNIMNYISIQDYNKKIKKQKYISCCSYSLSNDIVVITSKCNHTGVSEFYNKKNKNETFTSIYIDNPIEIINNEAFKCCKNLTNVKLNDNIKRINDWAFQDCCNLSSINIPDSVQHIGIYAFANCNLKKLIISKKQLIKFKEHFKLYIKDNNIEI